MSDEQSDVVTVNSENLDDFNFKTMGLPTAEEVQAAEVVESEAVEAAEAEDVEAEAQQEEVKDEKPKKKNSFQERISELTQARKDAEAIAERERTETDRLRKELEALKTSASPEPEVSTEPPGKPKQEDFKEWADYVEALSDWKVDQKFKAREAQQAEESAKQSWKKRVEEAKAELPDYDEVMRTGGDIALPNAVLAAIQESEIGPKIAHHLASNPEVAEALLKLSITSQVKEIGKIEASMAKAAEKAPEKAEVQVSKAPRPVTPIKGNVTYENKLDADGNFHGTPEEWQALRKAGKIK